MSSAPARLVSLFLTGERPENRPPPPEQTPIPGSALRLWIGPLLLLVATPVLAVLFWVVSTYYGGSLWRFATTTDLGTLWSQLPAPSVRALAMVAGFAAFQAVLMRVLPGKSLLGPPTPAGNQPPYKLNGVAAWLITHAAFFGASSGLGWFPASVLYDTFGELLATLNLLAWAFCAFLYWKGRRYPSSTDAVWTGRLAFDFFQGIELYPTLGGLSLKQLVNCRVSMMGWSLLVLSFAARQHASLGYLSPSMAVSAGLLVAYLFKFFWWEGGYLHSLDIMHDRFGFYLCWGVLVWVPAVYTLPAHYLTAHPVALPPWAVAGLLVLGAASLWANYAADAQRRRVRATGGQTTVWGRKPDTILARYRTRDGATRENLLLTSGFWGVARHFHYVPELALALAWSLPAGFDCFLPYFYWVFLFVLLVDRAKRDDRRCAQKYGEAWEEYRRRVPYKMLPGIY